MVFDFRLGQRRARRDAPIHRLLAAINKAFLNDVREQSQFIGLVFLVERQIGIVPVAQHTEPLELRALNVDVFAGVGVAGPADRHRVGAGIAGLAHFLRDLEFNRQAVTIPPGNIRRAFAAYGLVFDDDVLENFVQRGADMDVAIGKRRAVMQDKFWRTSALRLDFFV